MSSTLVSTYERTVIVNYIKSKNEYYRSSQFAI